MRPRPRSVIVPGAQSRGVTTSDNRPAPADLSHLSPGNQLLERAHCLILLPQRSSSLRPCVVVVPSLFTARDLKNHHSLKTSCGCSSEILSSNIRVYKYKRWRIFKSYKFFFLFFFSISRFMCQRLLGLRPTSLPSASLQSFTVLGLLPRSDPLCSLSLYPN